MTKIRKNSDSKNRIIVKRKKHLFVKKLDVAEQGYDRHGQRIISTLATGKISMVNIGL